MTAFIPEEFRPKLIESLQENGELAVTVEEFPSHETYQFRAVHRDREVLPTMLRSSIAFAGVL